MNRLGMLLRTRVTVLWFGLVAVTALSRALGHEASFGHVGHAGVVIIALAFVKVRYVLLDFMEIRNAPAFMRIIAEVWAVTVCAVLIVLYTSGPGSGP